MGGPGDRLVDRAQVKAVEATLETLEENLLRRIPIAAEKSPNLVFEELEALDLVLDLKMKLGLLS